jgi:outer membrane lipoprotein SlyB
MSVPSLALCALLAAAACIVAALPAAAQPACTNCGTVLSVSSVRSEQHLTSLGSLSPGTLAGDGFGSQPGGVTTQFAIGRGLTNDGMVVLGAAGGAAYARRSQNAPQMRWEVSVRMDDGTRRTLSQSYEPAVGEGDRVRVYGTQLELFSG